MADRFVYADSPLPVPSLEIRFPFPALLAMLWAIMPVAISAHGDDRVLIDALTEELAKAPDAELFIRRGELYRHLQQWALAEADYAAAARLAPKLAIVDFFRARACLEAGAPDRAAPWIKRYVAAEPAQAEGWFLRGEVLAALGDPAAGAADYAAGIRCVGQPRPEHFLRRAHFLAAIPGADPARELAALDEGIAQLGPIISLVDRAIELELARRNHAGALARIAAALENAPRRETWLVRQGDVLVASGRTAEAVVAYRGALAAIEELPESYRSTVPVEKLGRDARTALARLEMPAAAK
jgi:predicted Zn-dependent protease